MAFGNISTLYLPTAANAGSSQWGTDVRKLLDSADAGSDATTKMNHGTGGTSVVRTADPYTTTSADLDQSLYGWAVNPTDMNSVSGARRFMLAGNHVATLRVNHTATTAKNANFAMYIYRVGNAAGGRTRTQLGTANSGTVSIPGLAGELTVNITVSLGMIILEPDETIQYSFEVGAAGTTVTGDTITIFTGTQSSVVGKVDIPKLGTLYDQNISGSSTPAGALQKTNLKVLVSSAATAASIVKTGIVKSVSGSVTTASSLTKTVYKFFTGSITSSGSVKRQPSINQSGSISSSSTLTKIISLARNGTVASVGAITSKIPFLHLSGTNTPDGGITRKVAKKLVGSLATTSSDTRPTVVKYLSGAVTSSSSLFRAIAKFFTGSVSSSAAVTKIGNKNLTGSVTPTAATPRFTVVKNLTGFFWGPAGSGGAQIVRRIINNIFDD